MKKLFKNKEDEMLYHQAYEEVLNQFRVELKFMKIPTEFGFTHVIAAGDPKLPALVVLHGMTISSTMWFPNVQVWSEQRRVYLIDTVGDFGRSENAKILKTREDAENWFDEVINGLGLKNFDLAGHSMGGFLALNYARQNQEKVNRLLLFSPAGTFFPIGIKFFLKIYPAFLFRHPHFVKKAIDWFSVPGKEMDTKLKNQMTIAYQKGMPLLRIIPSVFKPEELKDFSVETLVLIGDKEVIYPGEEAVKKARKLIPNVTTHLIPDASHDLTYTQADLVNQLSIEFLVKGEGRCVS